MKVIMCSRHFPKGHPRQGESTWFVEKILSVVLRNANGRLNLDDINSAIRPLVNDFFIIDGDHNKHHTIRVGNRFKPGEMVSLRVWSGLPYRSKQIEFAQVEVKKIAPIEINNRFGAASFEVVIDGKIYGQLHYGNDKDHNKDGLILLAKNDGLELDDFVEWFNIHPKKTGLIFTGQIICWSLDVNY